MNYIIVIIIGYFIGTINPAIIVGRKVKGIDIRDVNSKNAGTSNIAITLGMKYAVLVGIIDILKGTIPVVILRLLYPDNDIIWFIGGLSAVLGHVYPMNLGFKGGKGTATFGGMIIGVAPLYSIALAIIFYVVTKLSDYIAVSTLLIVVIVPVGMYFLDYHYISIFLVSLYSLLSFYKHFPNLVRIYKKQELGLKEGLKKS